MSVPATGGFLDCVCAGTFAVFALVTVVVGGFCFFALLAAEVLLSPIEASRDSCAEAC